MNILFSEYGDYVLLLNIFYLDVYCKNCLIRQLDIIYLIFDDVVKVVILDLSNHTLKKLNAEVCVGGGCVGGVD